MSLARSVAVLAAVAFVGCSAPEPADTASPRRTETVTSAAPFASATDTVNPAPSDSRPQENVIADSAPERIVEIAHDTVPARIRRRFPSATSFASEDRPFPHGVIHGPAGTIGYEVDTDEAGTTQTGFGGPVPLLLWFDSDGQVSEVKVMGNDETPGYLQLVLRSGLLDSLKGRSATAVESVDAVTMATFSSRAVIDGVRLTADRVAAELLPLHRGRPR
jgi:uncharacterized protein with FMN-binding domain